jgi:hypothetical protein
MVNQNMAIMATSGNHGTMVNGHGNHVVKSAANHGNQQGVTMVKSCIKRGNHGNDRGKRINIESSVAAWQLKIDGNQIKGEQTIEPNRMSNQQTVPKQVVNQNEVE